MALCACSKNIIRLFIRLPSYINEGGEFELKCSLIALLFQEQVVDSNLTAASGSSLQTLSTLRFTSSVIYSRTSVVRTPFGP